MNFGSLSLRTKLPVLVVGLSLMVGVSLQVVNTVQFRIASDVSVAAQFQEVTGFVAQML